MSKGTDADYKGGKRTPKIKNLEDLLDYLTVEGSGGMKYIIEQESLMPQELVGLLADYGYSKDVERVLPLLYASGSLVNSKDYKGKPLGYKGASGPRGGTGGGTGSAPGGGPGVGRADTGGRLSGRGGNSFGGRGPQGGRDAGPGIGGGPGGRSGGPDGGRGGAFAEERQMQDLRDQLNALRDLIQNYQPPAGDGGGDGGGYNSPALPEYGGPSAAEIADLAAGQYGLRYSPLTLTDIQRTRVPAGAPTFPVQGGGNSGPLPSPAPTGYGWSNSSRWEYPFAQGGQVRRKGKC